MLKNTFHPGNHSQKASLALLLLRIGAGALMLMHGAGKFETLFGSEPIQFADPFGLGQTPSLALTVFAEVLCSILLILGLATRLAVIPLMITMFVAVVIIHAGDEMGKKELGILYFLIYLTFFAVGAGIYSLDYLIYRKRPDVG